MKPAIMILLALLITATLALAVPPQINYQGYLTTPAGVPIDTTVSMTFKFYGFGHVLLWQEDHATVTVTDGYFNVSLGSETFLSDSIFTSGFAYLQVTVGSDEPMFPSITSSTVPFAFRIGTVDGATGGTLFSSLSVGNTNTVPSYDCFAAGGGNVITNGPATIAGGGNNLISSTYGFIGAGVDNVVNSAAGVCGGGYENEILSSGAANVIGGGYHSDITGIGSYNVISGGSENLIMSNSGTIGGGSRNRVFGDYATIAGGGGPLEEDSNSASGTSSFIGAGRRNKVTGNYAFVGSGYGCQALGEMSVVGGGEYNYASGENATIAGGWQNQATAQEATVGGGNGNIASGSVSTIPGGAGNEATAFMATAMGFRAKANHIGSFVWADRTYQDFASAADNQFSLRATGGVRIATNSAGTIGVKLDNGDTAWEVLSDSTKKTNRKAANTASILEKVLQVPIEEWNYTHQDASNTHIGPMAQDFHALFGYGDDNTTISTIDPDGIALAAIQELAKRNAELESRVKHLEAALLQLGLKNTTESQ